SSSADRQWRRLKELSGAARFGDKFFTNLVVLCISSRKILLRRPVSSITSSGVFEDCSGGNSRPSRPSGVGGGTFLGIIEENVQRPTSNIQMRNSEISGRFSWPVALTLVVLIAAAAGIFVFWRLETWPARTIGQGAED